MKVDEKKCYRRGPAPLDPIEKRTHTVSTRLNVAELERLDELREKVKMRRGEYVRAAVFSQLPPTIPPLNREAWTILARAAANLNQVARHLNEGGALGIDEVRAALNDFRRGLIGAGEKNEG